MSKIKIIVDSCSSIKKDFAKKYDIEIIPINIIIDGLEINPLDTKMNNEEFFSLLNKKVSAKTAAISPNLYHDMFVKYINDGYDVIYISLSSGLSCSYNNSLLAKESVLEEFPNAKIECIDSLLGGSGIKIIVLEIIKLIEKGLNINEIKEKVDRNGLHLEALFTIGSLYHLYKGGRITLGKATLGTMLRLKPIIYANKEGKLENLTINIGKKKSLSEMCSRLISNIDGDLVYLSYTNNENEAKEVKDRLLSLRNDLNVIIDQIDYSLSCHCGPETIALFYKKK